MSTQPASDALLDSASDAFCLTADDVVFLRAVSMVGDVVRQPEWEYLIAHWTWAGAFSHARVMELIEAELLQHAEGGHFVPAHVASEVADRLPLGLHPRLIQIVGEALALRADSLERLRMGMRRLLVQPNDDVILAASVRWAGTEAGIAGPRGARYVDAIGGTKLSPAMQATLRAAVPEIRRPRWSPTLFMLSLRQGIRAATAIRIGLGLGAVAAVLTLGSCRSAPAPNSLTSAVEPREPRWFTAPPSSDGKLVAVAAREARTIQKAVSAADAETRTRLATMLRTHLGTVSDGVGAEVAPARRDEVLRALRPMALEVAKERADSAIRGDYLIEPRSRGYRAYVLTEVSTVAASRALAARIARSPALLAQVGGTAVYRALEGDTMTGTSPRQ